MPDLVISIVGVLLAAEGGATARRRRVTGVRAGLTSCARGALPPQDLLLAAADQPFRFPATFTFVVRSFSVLDGIGKTLDPRWGDRACRHTHTRADLGLCVFVFVCVCVCVCDGVCSMLPWEKCV